MNVTESILEKLLIAIEEQGRLRELLRASENKRASLESDLYQSQHRPSSSPDPLKLNDIVALLNAQSGKINAIRTVRAHLGMGLKEAKDLVEKHTAYTYQQAPTSSPQREPEYEDDVPF